MPAPKADQPRRQQSERQRGRACFPRRRSANRSIFYDRQGSARSVAGVYAELVRRYQVARASASPDAAWRPQRRVASRDVRLPTRRRRRAGAGRRRSPRPGRDAGRRRRATIAVLARRCRPCWHSPRAADGVGDRTQPSIRGAAFRSLFRTRGPASVGIAVVSGAVEPARRGREPLRPTPRASARRCAARGAVRRSISSATRPGRRSRSTCPATCRDRCAMLRRRASRRDRPHLRAVRARRAALTIRQSFAKIYGERFIKPHALA